VLDLGITMESFVDGNQTRSTTVPVAPDSCSDYHFPEVTGTVIATVWSFYPKLCKAQVLESWPGFGICCLSTLGWRAQASLTARLISVKPISFRDRIRKVDTAYATFSGLPTCSDQMVLTVNFKAILFSYISDLFMRV